MFGLLHTQLSHNAVAMGGATPFSGQLAGELREGAMGSAVRELQSKLNVLQYGPLNVDGTFGASTKQALMNFQQTEGVGGSPPSGVLDEETEARINQRILNVSNAAVNPATGIAPQPPAARPWWQTALMVAGGIALAGGVIYLLSEKESGGGYKRALNAGREPKDVPGRYNRSGERVAGLHRSRSKCDRTPGEDAFEAGEPLEVPS